MLRAAIEAFANPGVSFFIHIDSKADPESFQFLASAPNVCVLEQRFCNFWGGFSLVDSSIALLERAWQREFDRYLLVSDDSFPLLTYAKLCEALSEDRNWVGAATQNEHMRKRYENFYYNDSPATNPIPSLRGEGHFEASEHAALHDLAGLMRQGKKSLNVLFHCQQWWVLTHEAAGNVLHSYRTDHHLRQSFRFSMIPDESYIQTVAGLAQPDKLSRRALVWTDFSKQPKPYLYSSIETLAEAFESGMPFVRKIAGQPGLLKELASRIRG